MSKITMYSEIVEGNGKTIRENNLVRQHRYPIGVVVHLKFNRYHSGDLWVDGTAQLVVVEHQRDCDGSPLYGLATRPVAPPVSQDRVSMDSKILYRFFCGDWQGFGEDSLTDTGRRMEVVSWADYLRCLVGG